MTAIITIIALCFLVDAWYMANNAQKSLKKVAEIVDQKFAEHANRISEVEEKIGL